MKVRTSGDDTGSTKLVFNLDDDMTMEVQRAEKKSLILRFNLH